MSATSTDLRLIRVDVKFGTQSRGKVETSVDQVVAFLDQRIELTPPGGQRPDGVFFRGVLESDVKAVALGFHRRRPGVRFYVHYRHGMS